MSHPPAAPSLDQPARRRVAPRLDLPMLAIVAGLVLLTVLFTTRLGLDAFGAFIRDAAKTDDPTPVAVSVASANLHVPRNMIRFAAERGGRHPKLDLYVHWPSLTGFTPERAALFQSAATGPTVVYVTIRAEEGMSPEERFREVYPHVLSEETRTDAHGFVVRGFRPDFGYDGEQLYIARAPDRPLAARCSAGTADGGCLAEFRTADGLDVSYRFHPTLLGEWRALDAAMRDLIVEFAQPGQAD